MTRVRSVAQIRPATAADLPACAAIINAYIDATGWLPRMRPADEIAAMFTPDLLARRLVLVADDERRDDGAVDDGGIAGYASFDPETRFLAALYLRPHARGKGTGKSLLDAVKAAAPDGFALTVWRPNSAARRFYEREGMRVTAEGDDHDGLPVWHMAWRDGGTS